MTNEHTLRTKLRKIEALHAGATTPGEKESAWSAAERIRKRLGDVVAPLKSEPKPQIDRRVETKFPIPDPWSRKLFLAVCRRYAIPAYRHHGMRSQTVVVFASNQVLDDMLRPQFARYKSLLETTLFEATEKLIREQLRVDTDGLTELEVRPYGYTG